MSKSRVLRNNSHSSAAGDKFNKTENKPTNNDSYRQRLLRATTASSGLLVAAVGLCRLSLPSRALENNLSMGINYLCTLIQTYAHSRARYVPVLIPRRTKEPKRRHIGAPPQFADVSLLKVAIGRAVPYRNGGQLALSTFQSP